MVSLCCGCFRLWHCSRLPYFLQFSVFRWWSRRRISGLDCRANLNVRIKYPTAILLLLKWHVCWRVFDDELFSFNKRAQRGERGVAMHFCHYYRSLFVDRRLVEEVHIICRDELACDLASYRILNINCRSILPRFLSFDPVKHSIFPNEGFFGINCPSTHHHIFVE